MQKPVKRQQRGQVLVLVALALLVLVGILALAVDGGNLYAERRKMQNAADAAALAGARKLCFESGATEQDVIDEATRYAVDLNGAHGAQVTVSGTMTVTVVVTETADTFFARAIGFQTADVTARASAMCQGPAGAGNIWPLAVRYSVYESDERIGCGELFYAFVDSETITTTVCDLSRTRLSQSNSEPWPTCMIGVMPVGLPDVDSVNHISTSERGWLDLYQPPPPNHTICPHNCNADGGATIARCWVLNGHPGPIAIGDCLKTESGTKTSVLAMANDDRVQCEIYNLPLYQEACAQGETLLSCPGDEVVGPSTVNANKVRGFGCIRPIGYFTVDFWCDGSWSRNHKVMIVQKMCERYSNDHPIEGLRGRPMEGYQESCMTVEGLGTGQQPVDTDTIIIQLTE